MSVDEEIPPLLSAEEKLRQLATRDARARSPVTTYTQKLIVNAVRDAPTIPFDLSTAAFSTLFFSGRVDMSKLSQWLRDAGYCLRIEYHNKGNIDTVIQLTIGLYKNRGYVGKEAIAQHDVTGKSPSVYF